MLPFDSAIVLGINHQGPFTPEADKQPLSFWGWACSSKSIKNIPETGYPYTTGGGRASDCDDEHKRVVSGLCDKPVGRLRI